MLAQGLLNLFFQSCPPSRIFFKSFELSTKAEYAKVAFDTPRKASAGQGEIYKFLEQALSSGA